MIQTALLLFIVIGFLVLVHELGHFLAAKLCGVGVEEFSVGFGQVLLSRKGSSGTVWSLRALPFGGFVALQTESASKPSASKSKTANKTLEEVNLLKKLFIFLSGPFANLLTAFVIVFAILQIGCTKHSLIMEKPYMQLYVGDEIYAIDQVRVHSWEAALKNLQGKKQATFTIVRDAQPQNIIVNAETTTPPRSLLAKAINKLLPAKIATQTTHNWNIVTQKCKEYKSFWNAFFAAYHFIVKAIWEFFGLLKIIGQKGVSVLAGPVGIAKGLTKAWIESKEALFWGIVKLSISLGLINLLPFPGLDGGQALVAILNAVTRQRISQKMIAVWNVLGLACLAGLMVYVTLLDLIR